MLRTLLTRCLAVSLALTLAGCGSGGGGGGGGGAMTDVSLVLTDAASDELSVFEVDVQNVVFTKLNGNTVSVLPRTTRVDFLELESLGELITGVSLEAGTYKQVTLELDFAAARVVIAGHTTTATVRDARGNAITGVVPVTIDFPAGRRPIVRVGRNNLFVFDLALDQSVVVDEPGNVVTFTPVWTVEIDPASPKPIATTGVLQRVDVNNLAFVVERRATDDALIAEFTVETGGSTVFQLGGDVQVGAPGLGALVAHIGERVFVQGTLDATRRVLRAVAVESGAGVPGNGQDWVLGHVVARTGGAGVDATLQVLGRSLDVSAGTRRFNTVHTVNVSHADTKVLRRGAGNRLDSDAINIGQLVWVFGDLSTTTLDATAATGVVRLLRTSIFGIANGAPAGDTLTVDVTRFDLRDVSAFDFDVSGSVQADPDAYTIDVTGVSTTGITTGSKLRVFGWIAGVDASGADATASSIVDRTTTASVMLVQWSTPRLGVLDALAASLSVDVSAASVRFVGDGFGSTFLTASPTPTVLPLTTVGLYSIVENGSIETNTSFPTFRQSVLSRAATVPVFRVAAFGTFDAGTQAFSALTVTVVLD
ncbi:MAG: DUF4382 domain-containing protein [Planctomycetes bacterium]|nr:DUF4382 domain-containing protein [Planctomycetota bacterium]